MEPLQAGTRRVRQAGGDATYRRDRRRIAGAWPSATSPTGQEPCWRPSPSSSAAAVLLSAQPIAVTGMLNSVVEWAASIGAVIALAIAAWLVALLRSAYASSAKRRGIGVVWDVGTFWPRAAHPRPTVLRRASGAGSRRPHQRADRETARRHRGDPDRNERICHRSEWAHGPGRASAAHRLQPGLDHRPRRGRTAPRERSRAGRPADPRLPGTATYGRAFPAFFGPEHLATLVSDLRDDELRWKNAFRRSDFIGSWIERREPTGTPDELDVLCHDPVALVPDSWPTRSPIPRHSAWWPDPQVGTVAKCLVTQLQSRSATQAPPGPQLPQHQADHQDHYFYDREDSDGQTQRELEVFLDQREVDAVDVGGEKRSSAGGQEGAARSGREWPWQPAALVRPDRHRRPPARHRLPRDATRDRDPAQEPRRTVGNAEKILGRPNTTVTLGIYSRVVDPGSPPQSLRSTTPRSPPGTSSVRRRPVRTGATRLHCCHNLRQTDLSQDPKNMYWRAIPELERLRTRVNSAHRAAHRL